MSDYNLEDLESLEQFWEKEVDPIIDQLFGGNYRIAEIQKLYDENRDLIAKRHKRPRIKLLAMARITHQLEGRVNCVCYKEVVFEKFLLFFKRKVTNLVIKANVHDLLLEQCETKAAFTQFWQRNFEATVIIDFLHEFDHFALDTLEGLDAGFDTFLHNESVTWARTCENAIRIFYQTQQVQLQPTHMLMYSTWLSSNKNINSNTWKSFIYQRYSHYAGRNFA